LFFSPFVFYRIINIETMGESMKSEENRLKSFETKKWPKPEVSPDLLAASGFSYSGIDDITKCAFCKLFVCCWTTADIPDEIHRICMRDCPMVTGKQCSNIPLQQQQQPPVFVRKNGGVDVCGLHK
jgi:hypothetical protein